MERVKRLVYGLVLFVFLTVAITIGIRVGFVEQLMFFLIFLGLVALGVFSFLGIVFDSIREI